MYANLAGLPPLLIEVGEYEMLLDQILLFAAKAKAAGLTVSCTPAPEMVHVYQVFPQGGDPETSEPAKSLQRIGEFVAGVTSVHRARQRQRERERRERREREQERQERQSRAAGAGV